MLHVAMYILLCGAVMTVVVSLIGIIGAAKSKSGFLLTYLVMSVLAVTTSLAGMIITLKSGDIRRGIQTVVLILFQCYFSYVIFRYRKDLLKPQADVEDMNDPESEKKEPII
ncbi:hypothetical protein K7432_017292 [Basidiobolus ranarum]|uniref:Uncharacterized protein n=1 Tax=Basidiobolus ranarum TaxID=34480 RepID=A0ABR2WDK4_9FUNG